LARSGRNTGRLTKSPLALDRKHRTNKKLEQRILTILGVQEMNNTYISSRGQISPYQISKQVSDLILRSSDNILDTMYRMQERGLLRAAKTQFEYEEDEIPFKITTEGIIQFRKKYIRPIARMVINHEEQYQTIIEKTVGDPKVKGELKKVPQEIKESVDGYSKIKAGIKKGSKKLMENVENRVYNIIAAAIFVTKLVFFKEELATELQDLGS
jgi:hypothetical protein